MDSTSRDTLLQGMKNLNKVRSKIVYLLCIYICYHAEIMLPRDSFKKISQLNVFISDSKSCLSGLNWPRSGKNTHFLALFWLVEGALCIGWK